MLVFSIAGFLSLYALQRLQGVLPLNPQGFDAVAARPRLQHRDQLHHQHQLAELRRRDDDEPSHADARPDRPQLPVRRDRHRDGVRAGARLRAVVGARRVGNFWVDVTRITLYVLLPISIVFALRARGARRAADACRRGRRDDARRRQADDRDRAGREPGDRSSSSAPTAAASSTPIRRIRSRTRTRWTNFLRDLGDPRRPGRLVLASSAAWSATSGRAARDPRRDGGLSARRRRRRLLGRAARQSDR